MFRPERSGMRLALMILAVLGVLALASPADAAGRGVVAVRGPRGGGVAAYRGPAGGAVAVRGPAGGVAYRGAFYGGYRGAYYGAYRGAYYGYGYSYPSYNYAPPAYYYYGGAVIVP
jgi:hypothetical protein